MHDAAGLARSDVALADEAQDLALRWREARATDRHALDLVAIDRELRGRHARRLSLPVRAGGEARVLRVRSSAREIASGCASPR
jgi:hypothetical protein